MRSQPLLPVSARFALAILMSVFLASLACQGSSTVTGPSGGTSSPSALAISGSWTGTYAPDDAVRCSGSLASATFQQNGGEVTGHISTSACGVTGYFRGSIQRSTLIGRISMQGCTGGGVSGVFDGARLTLSIADLTKPLVTGQTPVMTGGVVALHR